MFIRNLRKSLTPAKEFLASTLALACALCVFVSQDALADHDPFNVIKVNIDMEEINAVLPVPNYEMVDIVGDFKNAPGSIACGGVIPEGMDEDADICLLRPQRTFTDGYMDTNGTVVTPNAAVYNGKIAGLEVHGRVGDIVELTVNNKLPADANDDNIADSTGFFAPESNLQSVHWHGMELDNESDGTPITESGIPTGNSRLYRFRLYRPGPFWFHPHVLPLLTESRGMVGRLIVRDLPEQQLEYFGVLPKIHKAFTLSDSTVANTYNQFTVDGTNENATEIELFSDFEVQNNLMPNITPDLDGDGACDRGPGDCIVEEGELVFVNGVVPTGDHDIPTVYVREGGGARLAFINSSNERFYRFRLLLDGEAPPAGPAERVRRSTTGECYAPGSTDPFTGADPLSCEQGLPLYRVGGEGGILDHARLEGQPELAPGEPARAYDTVIRTGEDVIGPAERTEFVVVTKDRNGNYLQPGDEMFIWMVDYPHGLFNVKFDNTIGDGRPRNRDIVARKLVRIKIVPNFFWWLPDYDIAAGDPLLAHPFINRLTENIRDVTPDELSAVPLNTDPDVGGLAYAGSTDNAFTLGNRVIDDGRFPAINGNRGHYEGTDGTIGDLVPTQDSTRYARVGDVIEFIYANDTGAAHHPFHMHGFSFQPIAIYDMVGIDADDDGVNETAELGDLLYEYDYNEFIDVILMQPQKAVKFRMQMNDRFLIPDEDIYAPWEYGIRYPYDRDQPYGGSGDIDIFGLSEMGGAVGRWLFHCHILHHAGLGMISDLCVASEDDPDGSGCKIDIDENISFPTPPWL